jgi:hypothetical protein
MEASMPYTLDQFCSDTRSILKAQPLADALPKVAARLSDLLVSPDFVAATFSDDTPVGRRELFHDPELDFYVLAHVQEGGKTGKPHSHGTSWAIYGNARNLTEMTEYRRVNPESEENVVLAPSAQYALRPGQTRSYEPGVIHSTAHPEKAWVIRVTGTDLDKLPRYRLRKQDRVLEKA